jgi:alkanesulfonate monooxygenase SsuD/methylene tetrahydromethanopterin reductase-like flavin-dependent oxidoreductase (luciferase family)
MRTAVFVPIFDELADPRLMADLAVLAEEKGWDGFFIWDHLQYRPPVQAALDPWIAMAAIACRTERLLLGPMVTPVARRRPAKLAREVVTLDHLSNGRLIFGAGLGGDGARELSAFGDETDPKRRAALLDEGLDVLQALWSGEEVDHHGEGYTVDGVRFLPRPVNGTVPIWLAARWPNKAPIRRAARYDGLFPIELKHPDQLRELLDEVREHRTSTDPFDVAVQGDPTDDATPWHEAGATWWLTRFRHSVGAAEVRSVIEAGPPPVPAV